MAEKHPHKHVNHLFKAMNDFFQHRPAARGVLESIDELFTPTPLGNGFPIELKENEKEYIVEAKLPGIKKEQIEIKVIHQHLTIAVQHQETLMKEDLKGESVRRKDSYKRLSRTIPFVKAIDSRHISAGYENGLLTIKIPKLKGKRIGIK